MKSVKASAPAKVILFGEHFVVHGGSALLASIDKRITATANLGGNQVVISSRFGSVEAEIHSSDGHVESNHKELFPLLRAITDIVNEFASTRGSGVAVRIDSEVLPGIGLGSSAAACVSTVAAVASLFSSPSRQWICERAIAVERIIHGTTSGADCYASTHGGIVSYSRTSGMSRLSSEVFLPLIVCNTGSAHSTRDQVANVEKFKSHNLQYFNQLLNEAQNIYQKAILALNDNDMKLLGALMSDNQSLLQKIGVSHPRAEQIVEISQELGALGAKITGAGGGGAVIMLAQSPAHSGTIMSALEKKGYQPFLTSIDSRGLELSQG